MEIKRNILLNPGPATTSNTVKYAQVVTDICPRENEFTIIVASILMDIVKIVHGELHYTSVLFAGSGTAAIDACINSVVPEGKKIFVINNGAYGKRMIDIANCYGIGVVSYDITCGDIPDLVTIEKLLFENKENLSHVCVVHHETSSGILNPLEDILKIVRKFNLEIIVDAMSSYAGIPISLSQTDYDYLISSSNKNLQGMAGISFVIFKKAHINKLIHIKKRSYYLNLIQHYQFFLKYGQMQFTPPVQVIYAMQQAILEYFDEGEKSRYDRYCQNWKTLISGLKKIGFRFLLPEQRQSKLLTSILYPPDPNFSFDEMHDYFYERGFTIYPGKSENKESFRIANIGEIFQKDIENFLMNLNAYVKWANIKTF